MLLCICNRICIFLAIIFNFYFNLYVFNSGKIVVQKCQVTVTSLGYHCRHSEGRPSGSWLLKFLLLAWKDERVWDGEWQRYGYGIWKNGLNIKPRWETDVENQDSKFVWWRCWRWEWCFSENVPCHQSLSIKLVTKVLALNRKRLTSRKRYSEMWCAASLD